MVFAAGPSRYAKERSRRPRVSPLTHRLSHARSLRPMRRRARFSLRAANPRRALPIPRRPPLGALSSSAQGQQDGGDGLARSAPPPRSPPCKAVASRGNRRLMAGRGGQGWRAAASARERRPRGRRMGPPPVAGPGRRRGRTHQPGAAGPEWGAAGPGRKWPCRACLARGGGRAAHVVPACAGMRLSGGTGEELGPAAACRAPGEEDGRPRQVRAARAARIERAAARGRRSVPPLVRSAPGRRRGPRDSVVSPLRAPLPAPAG